MTSKKLYGKDLKEFDDVDVDDLLTQLSAEELEILSKEVDPDVRKLMFWLLVKDIGLLSVHFETFYVT